MMAESSTMADEELAQRVQAGDHPAFARLVERHASRFYRLAYRLLQNANDAEDMVQNTFLKFWQNPQRWDPDQKGKFTTWLYRVLTNACLDFLKRKRPEPLNPEETPDLKGKNLEDGMEQEHRQKFMEQWVRELPDRQRLALNLCFYQGLSHREAAEVMGVRLKALQSLLMRAKGKLREKAETLHQGNAP